MPKPELKTEHAALLAERTKLRKLCMDEWPIMSAQLAKVRQDRLWAIWERLKTIERSPAWRYRNV